MNEKISLRDCLDYMKYIHEQTGYDVYFSRRGDGFVNVKVEEWIYQLND